MWRRFWCVAICFMVTDVRCERPLSAINIVIIRRSGVWTSALPVSASCPLSSRPFSYSHPPRSPHRWEKSVKAGRVLQIIPLLKGAKPSRLKDTRYFPFEKYRRRRRRRGKRKINTHLAFISPSYSASLYFVFILYWHKIKSACK